MRRAKKAFLSSYKEIHALDSSGEYVLQTCSNLNWHLKFGKYIFTMAKETRLKLVHNRSHEVSVLRSRNVFPDDNKVTTRTTKLRDQKYTSPMK